MGVSLQFTKGVEDADLRQDPDREDHHSRGGGYRHYRGREGQNPGQGGHPPLTSSVSSSPGNSSRTAAPFRTITSRRSRLSTSCSACAVLVLTSPTPGRSPLLRCVGSGRRSACAVCSASVARCVNAQSKRLIQQQVRV